MRHHLLFDVDGVLLALPTERVRRVERDDGRPAAELALLLGRLPVPGAEQVLVELHESPQPLRADRVLGMRAESELRFSSLPAHARLQRPLLGRALIGANAEVAFELRVEALTERSAPLKRALRPEPGAPAPPPGRMLLFRHGGRGFCAPISLVQSVLRAPRLYEVPLTPTAHAGVIVHDGSLLSVFELPTLLEARPRTGGGWVVVVDAGGEAVGLVADELPTVLASVELPLAGEQPVVGGTTVEGPDGLRLTLPALDRLFRPGPSAGGAQ